MGYFLDSFRALGTTLRNFLRPPVTIEYPQVIRPRPERHRVSFALLIDEIGREEGGGVGVIDSPSIVANQLKMILEKHHLLNDKNPDPQYQFYLSDLTKNFERISKKFFGNSIKLELKSL